MRGSGRDTPGGVGPWFYRVLLRLHPRAFRERFGPEMLAVFRRRVQRPGPGRSVRILFELTDLLFSAPRMHARGWLRHWGLRGTPAARLAVRGLQRKPTPREILMSLSTDLRIAARSLRRRPGFSLVALVTLALGIGMNAAIFSLVHALLLRPLPYPDADRLVAVYETSEGRPQTLSPVNFLDFRERATSFEQMAVYNRENGVLTGRGQPRMVSGAQVTPGFFDVLGVVPLEGRVFLPEEEEGGHELTCIVSESFWKGTLGGSEDVLEQTLRLDDIPFHIVGVVPAAFDFPTGAQVWVPFRMIPSDLEGQRGAHYLSSIGRLRPGVSIDSADEELSGIAAELAETYPNSNFGYGATVRSLRDDLVGDVRPTLILLLVAVGTILLIACANLTNLFFSRALTRTREFQIRRSLGAHPRQLVWNVFSEGLLLSLVGGGAALGVAALGLQVSRPLWAPALPQMGPIGLDPAVLLFTLGIAVLTGLLFGVLPALRVGLASQVPGTADAAENRVSTDRSGRRTRGLLVTVQVALSVVLLTGAALLVRSMDRLGRVDPGFEPQDLFTFAVSLPDQRYQSADPQRSADFFRDLRSRLEALPGVEHAAGAFGLPFTGFSYTISVSSVDGVRPATPADEQYVGVRIVQDGYFATMGMRLLEGRGFTASDRNGSERVVLLNRSAARLLLGDEDPIDHEVIIGTSLGLGRGRAGGRIIGVVEDAHQYSLQRDPMPEMFMVYDQFPMGFMRMAVRTRGPQTVLAGQVRDAVASIDPELPVYGVRMMTDWIADTVREPRLYTVLLGLFALLALVISAVGVFGVLSFSMARRNREIGIRMAVGARAGEVVRMVVGEGMRLVLLGVAIGLVGAAAGSSLLAGFLFGIAPLDPFSYLAGAVVLTGIALLACWIPARGATRVDPVEVLRTE